MFGPTVVREVFDRLQLREWRVANVQVLGPRFRRVDLECAHLSAADFAPGDKVQVMLGLVARTYTPFDVDPARGRMSLLVHVRGDGPGARWGAQVAEGQAVRVFGPRSSLKLTRTHGQAVMFGDETSFALAHCLTRCAAQTRLVFEVERPDEASVVLAELGILTDGLVHRSDARPQRLEVQERMREALLAWPDAQLVMTGGAPAIQAMRKQLGKVLPPRSKQLVKAYWSPGKRGLD